ncbi:DUF2845 domain-containing protein [Dyella subtropica]|uniref:DUF2845 domain-containing protein n=1 Tax=Dyella subtropica TaxID=2992127 RepID=UPI00224DFF6D|nr:DUF2845 domain-containing protein [Dyella subtropica]
MRRIFLLVLLAWAWDARASDTLRVGNKVLTTGDSAARVVELLGKPTHKARGNKAGSGKSSSAKHKGKKPEAKGGERWQYRRGSRTTTITMVDGKVAHIDERG